MSFTKEERYINPYTDFGFKTETTPLKNDQENRPHDS